MLLERILSYGAIVLLCIAVGYMKNVQWRLEAELKDSKKNQTNILEFCKENEKVRDRVKEALENNKEGVDGFNNVLDILFEKKVKN